MTPRVKARNQHHDAMPWADVPTFYAALSDRSAMAAQALRFTILTAARTSEVLEAEWSEVDLDARQWVIPAQRMKAGEEHRVPLTIEMLAILEPLRNLGGRYVFEGQKRYAPLSNMSMLMLLRRMGAEGFTVHGFRSSFRDWAAETESAPRELAEAALAQQVGSEVERAYARSDLLERRRGLMNSWSSFVDGK